MILWIHVVHTVVTHGWSGLVVFVAGMWLITCDYCSCMCGFLAHTKSYPFWNLENVAYPSEKYLRFHSMYNTYQ